MHFQREQLFLFILMINYCNKFRRGFSKSKIYDIAFHDLWIAVSSESGTVHLFSRKTQNQLFNFPDSFPIKINRYSFGQFKVPPKRKTLLAFSKDDLIVITINHIYYIPYEGN